MRNSPLITGLLFLTVMICTSVCLAKKPVISFTRDIRPILSNKCFECHGPDEDARQSELRLDTKEGIASVTKGLGSELWHRISAEDDSKRMPPSDFDKSLTDSEIITIRNWLRSGAKWEMHWAFEPISDPVVQEPNPDWGHNSIDQFVLEAMKQRGLSPSPSTDAHTLLRRVFLDLIGLPATAEEVVHWIQRIRTPNGAIDQDGYLELVTHLLNRSEYGERWARRWLDLARYADTNGYEKDRDRPMWPYRDWVIRAINEGMSYKQFTIEQIAGDMLTNATVSQRVATGFHRNTMLNEEGGIDPLEFRFYAMTDRVATTGTTWLGLTIGCAQCHTHKFDPISHSEYYQFMALLDNTDEPEMDIPDEQVDSDYKMRLREAQEQVEELESHWPDNANGEQTEEISAAYEEWLIGQRKRARAWTPLIPAAMRSNMPLLAHEGDGVIFASGDSTKHDVYELEFDVSVRDAKSIRIEALPDPRLPAYGPGMTFYEGTLGAFFLTELILEVDGELVEFTDASHSYAKNRFGGQNVGAKKIIDGDIQTGWSTHDRAGERHVAILSTSGKIPAGKWKVIMHYGRHFSSSLGKFKLSVSNEDKPTDARELDQQSEALLLREPASLSAEEHITLRNAFLLGRDELKGQSQQIRELRSRPRYQRALVMRERPAGHPRPTFIHPRGEYAQTSAEVLGGVPEVLPGLNVKGRPNRLDFAEWIVREDNPLTARVAVNRAWSAFFGKGLVATLDDFGFQGSSPSHPELLDHLATNLMKADWDLREIHKSIVLSATYQQSSILPEMTQSKDPGNVWLSYMPRLRIDAEVIRDSILLSSGLLSKKMFGPPVKPLQPDGISDIAFGSPKWQASDGEDRYRRSIYTYSKRTTPFAMFSTFDAPSGESCVARRGRSNSALQALTLLNDVMFMDAARRFGTEVHSMNGSETEKISQLFIRLLNRDPTREETADVMAFYLGRLVEFERDQESAVALMGEDISTVSEVAAWTLVCRALFSLDEVVMRN